MSALRRGYTEAVNNIRPTRQRVYRVGQGRMLTKLSAFAPKLTSLIGLYRTLDVGPV